MTDKRPLRGLDYQPVRDWHYKKLIRIANLPADLAIPRSATNCVAEIPIVGEHPAEWFDPHWLQNQVFDRFPVLAMERLTPFLRGIIIEQTTWFDRKSTASNPRPTTILGRALSPTALIPASCYLDQDEHDHWQFKIYIYPLPEDFVSDEVHQLLLIQALVHELCHGLVKLPWRLIIDRLQIGDEIIDGEEAIIRFLRLIRGIPPISEYSDSYRNGLTVCDEPSLLKGKFLPLWVEEEFVECLTAALLRYANCPQRSTNTNFRPFKDRPKVYDYLVQFLNATWQRV